MTERMYQQVNLYQPIFRRQRQIFSAAAMFQAVGVLIVALLALHGYSVWQVIGLEAEAVQLEGRVKADTAQLARLDPTASVQRRRDVEAELERLTATLADQQRLIDVLERQPLGTTDGLSAYLAALARRHSRGVWLTELTINGGSKAIELVGQTVDPGLVPGYLIELGKEEALAGQRFDKFEIERSEDGGNATFRVTSRAAAGDDRRVAAEGRRR